MHEDEAHSVLYERLFKGANAGVVPVHHFYFITLPKVIFGVVAVELSLTMATTSPASGGSSSSSSGPCALGWVGGSTASLW